MVIIDPLVAYISDRNINQSKGARSGHGCGGWLSATTAPSSAFAIPANSTRAGPLMYRDQGHLDIIGATHLSL